MDFKEFYFDSEADVIRFVDAHWDRVFNVSYEIDRRVGWVVRVLHASKTMPKKG